MEKKEFVVGYVERDPVMGIIGHYNGNKVD